MRGTSCGTNKKKNNPVAGGVSWDVTPRSPFLVEILGLIRGEFVPVFLRAGLLLPTFSSSHSLVSMSRGLQYTKVLPNIILCLAANDTGF